MSSRKAQPTRLHYFAQLAFGKDSPIIMTNAQTADRIIPQGMHLISSGCLQPYDPSECNPDILTEDRLIYLHGDLEGVALFRKVADDIAKIWGCSRDEAIEKLSDEIREDLMPFAKSHKLVDLLGIDEYKSKKSHFTMQKDEIQAEVDALRRQYGFEPDILALIVRDGSKKTTAGYTRFYGMPGSNRPHCIVIGITPHTLKTGKPSIRSTIRHEFAHCLANMETWKEKGCDSWDHITPEWLEACQVLGIMPDGNVSPHETGYYRFSCPSCGKSYCSLRWDKESDAHVDRRICGKCHQKMKVEIFPECICFGGNRVYSVEEDGRNVLLSVNAEDFLDVKPEEFDLYAYKLGILPVS